MGKKILINVSKHPLKNWTNEMKKGWDTIFEIKPPYIKYYELDNLEKEADAVLAKVKEIIKTLAIDDYAWINLSCDHILYPILYDKVNDELPLALCVNDKVGTELIFKK